MEFEADIAIISGLVIVICESPGSLAELGAFAFDKDISRNLYVILERGHIDGVKSFIRNGPILALENEDESKVGTFDWRKRKSGTLIFESLKQIKKELPHNVNSRIKKGLMKYSSLEKNHIILTIYWIIYILRAATLSEIEKYMEIIGIELSQHNLKKYLYGMKVAEWIGIRNIGSKYYHTVADIEVLDYAFKSGSENNSPSRWKLEVSSDIDRISKRPDALFNNAGSGE